jgi:outer membrane protein assembly factor BamB
VRRLRAWQQILLASLVATAGCGSPGPKPAPLESFKPSLRVAQVWRTELGHSGPYVLSPGVLGESVYAASAAGNLFRIRAADGKVIWQVKTKTRLSGGVGVGNNLILVGTAKGSVLAFDLDGKALWHSQVSSQVLSAPLAAGDLVVVRSGDNRIFGLDAKDGARRWVYQSNQPALTLRASHSFALADKLVIVGMPAGRLVAVDLANGGLVWEVAVGIPKGDNEIERITDIAGQPLVEPGRICAVTFQGRAACYETQQGGQIWARALSSAASLGADGLSVYVSEAEGAVQALEKNTGTSVWRQDRLGYRYLSAPLVYDGQVVVGDFEGQVHFLRSDDGGFAARIATDGSAISAAPVASGGRVFVQTRSGGLYAFEIRK